MSPSSSLLLLAKTITHPAARSLCDSWASCSVICRKVTITSIRNYAKTLQRDSLHTALACRYVAVTAVACRLQSSPISAHMLKFWKISAGLSGYFDSCLGSYKDHIYRRFNRCCRIRLWFKLKLGVLQCSVWYPDVLIFTVTGKLFIIYFLPGTRGPLHSGPLDFAHLVHVPPLLRDCQGLLSL